MRRGCVALSAFALIGIGLASCGRSLFEVREPWRAQAEEACLASRLVTPSAYMSRISEIDGPGTCGISYPFRVSAFTEGSVALTSRLTLACPIIPEVEAWLARTVQPAAELYLGSRVTDIRGGSYSCRGRNNQPGARASEHAYGNAIDVMSFRLADGREVNVERGWRGATEEQDFLREVFVGACRYFTTVLGPGSDVFHYNHLHLDLARHDPRGLRHVCRPAIKFEPRLDPDGSARATPVPLANRPPAPATPAARPEPGDEDDDDGFAVSSTRPAPRPGSARPEERRAVERPREPLPLGPSRPGSTASAGEPLSLQPRGGAGSGLN